MNELNTLYISDGAKVVTDCGVGATGSIREAEANYDRLLLVTSKARNMPAMTRALLPVVVMVQYRFETSTFDSILNLISQAVGARKLSSIALVFHSVNNVVYLCNQDGGQVLNSNNIKDQGSAVQRFFETLSNTYLKNKKSNRIDILACPLAEETADGTQFLRDFSTSIKSKALITMSTDLIGNSPLKSRVHSAKAKTSAIGSIYFQLDLLTESIRQGATYLNQSTAVYEKIRVVGKGAFGAAVLYRRRDDDSYVILKEINMHDLSVNERQLALNEVAVLSRLQHPNIITYYDSFEEDGVLMIEMEYAEGGSLAQYLAKRTRQLEEREILQMFDQMVSSVHYLHENNVLHRDLKTANIFLTKDNTVKLGDFGISKVMSTHTRAIGANTVLGTPYYISPEMCEGKPYNEKSDIWALGCILYEMACLQKTFEGSNLPALVNKIMKGQYDQIRGNYSSEFKSLVRDLLHRDPESRPNSRELSQKLQRLLERFNDGQPFRLSEEVAYESSDSTGTTRSKLRSVLYALDAVKGQSTQITHRLIEGLPPKIRIRMIALGRNHQIVLSTEKLVYSWGDNTCGQLALDDFESRRTPTLVQSLTGKSIARIAVGDHMSVFCSDNGIVMTCGRWDLVGHGPIDSNVSRPKLIESLLNTDIVQIGCGAEHSCVVGEGGQVYAWGCGEHGRLGTGLQQDEYHATEVHIPQSYHVRSVRCGHDCTLLLTQTGTLLAMGSNQNNKLNLNHRQGFFSHMKLTKPDIDRALVPTVCKNLSSRVLDASVGLDHTAVLLESGHIYTFGSNSRGQLGRGQSHSSGGPTLVKALANVPCMMIRCGDGFTLAATTNNHVYFWGTRSIDQPDTNTEEFVLSSVSPNESLSITTPPSQSLSLSVPNSVGKPTALVHPFAPEQDRIAIHDAIADSTAFAISLSGDAAANQLQAAASERTRTQSDSTEGDADAVKPTQILQLDSTRHVSIAIGSLVVNYTQVWLVVDTSAPLPKSVGYDETSSREERSPQHSTDRVALRPATQAHTSGQLLMSAPQQVRTTDGLLSPLNATPRSRTSTPARRHEETKMSLAPEWLKRELDDATLLPVGSNRRNKSDDNRSVKTPSRRSSRQPNAPRTSSSSPDRLATSVNNDNAPSRATTGRRKKRRRARSAEVQRLRAEKAQAESQLVNLKSSLEEQKSKQKEAERRELELQQELNLIKQQMHSAKPGSSNRSNRVQHSAQSRGSVDPKSSICVIL